MLNLAGKKVFVTGATGFLGRHLTPKLLDAGAEVTALVRSSGRNLPPRVNVVQGDCAALPTIGEQDIVIHLAGLLFGADWQSYFRANFAFAKNIAAATGNGRAIFVSSLAAAGPCGTPPGKKETDRPEPVSAYGWSKLLAEQALAAALGERLTILRPPIIYGSGDRALLPLFKSCAAGFGVSPGKFPLSLIHADDAARAILLAAAGPASGIYHLSDGEIYDMDIICAAMAKAQGKKKPFVIRPPLALMGLAASFSGAGFALQNSLRKLAGLSGAKPPVWNRDKYLEARQDGWLANGSRIAVELGFRSALNLESGMAEAVAGYRAGGWL